MDSEDEESFLIFPLDLFKVNAWQEREHFLCLIGNLGPAQMGKSRLLDKIYPCRTILGTRTFFIQAVPNIFCRVNGASETLPDH